MRPRLLISKQFRESRPTIGEQKKQSVLQNVVLARPPRDRGYSRQNCSFEEPLKRAQAKPVEEGKSTAAVRWPDSPLTPQTIESKQESQIFAEIPDDGNG